MSDTVETPTQQIIRANAPVEMTCTDARGRVIVFKAHNAVSRWKLLGICPPDRVTNQYWLSMVLMATTVQTIDGIPVPVPRSLDQVEALIAQLDDDGLGAIGEALNS